MLRNYLTMAVKVLLRRKLFTAISLFGITSTLICLVLAMAFVDHVLGPVYPELRQDRTLTPCCSHMIAADGSSVRGGPGRDFYARHLRDLPGVERVSKFHDPERLKSYRNGNRIDSGLKRTDAEFWKILSFSFLEGGPYTEDDVRQARPVAVISETTRAKIFDGAPALGRTLEVEGVRFVVTGVVRDVSPLRMIPWADIWAPLTSPGADAPKRGGKSGIPGPGGDGIIVLARTRADISRIKDELPVLLARHWESPDPAKYPRVVAFLQTSFEGWARLFGSGRQGGQVSRLWAFMTVVALLFMVLPAVNLINLNVSRILERASEIGVRKSFGASSRALVAQFVVENVLLTAIGGVLALLVSALLLAGLAATGVFGAAQFTVNVRVFLVGMGLALFFGLVSGVYPAWKMSRMHPLAALRGAKR